MFEKIEGVLFEVKNDVIGDEAKKVVSDVKEYFTEHLPQYEVVKIRRKSFHKDDAHLFMVAAKKEDGTFSVFTCWNQLIQSLNHGHYGLADLGVCDKIMDEFYNDGE